MAISDATPIPRTPGGLGPSETSLPAGPAAPQPPSRPRRPPKWLIEGVAVLVVIGTASLAFFAYFGARPSGLVGPEGGLVVSPSGAALSIPAGALDAPTAVTVRDLTLGDIEALLGRAFSSLTAGGQSLAFYGAVEIVLNRTRAPAEFLRPVTLESPPAPSTPSSAEYLVATVLPDADGDGFGELVALAEAASTARRTVVTRDPTPVSLARAATFFGNGTAAQVDWGALVVLQGDGFRVASPLGYRATFTGTSASADAPAFFANGTGLGIVVPWLPPGAYTVRIRNLQTGLESAALALDVRDPPGAPAGAAAQFLSAVAGAVGQAASSLDATDAWKPNAATALAALQRELQNASGLSLPPEADALVEASTLPSRLGSPLPLGDLLVASGGVLLAAGDAIVRLGQAGGPALVVLAGGVLSAGLAISLAGALPYALAAPRSSPFALGLADEGVLAFLGTAPSVAARGVVARPTPDGKGFEPASGLRVGLLLAGADAFSDLVDPYGNYRVPGAIPDATFKVRGVEASTLDGDSRVGVGLAVPGGDEAEGGLFHGRQGWSARTAVPLTNGSARFEAWPGPSESGGWFYRVQVAVGEDVVVTMNQGGSGITAEMDLYAPDGRLKKSWTGPELAKRLIEENSTEAGAYVVEVVNRDPATVRGTFQMRAAVGVLPGISRNRPVLIVPGTATGILPGPSLDYGVWFAYDAPAGAGMECTVPNPSLDMTLDMLDPGGALIARAVGADPLVVQNSASLTARYYAQVYLTVPDQGGAPFAMTLRLL